MEGTHEEYRVYACASYGVLKEWLRTVEVNLDASAEALLVQADAIHAELRFFLLEHSFDEYWPKLQQQASSREQLRAQFHRWFDGFKTLKMIHHLRDRVFPDEPTFRAYSALSRVMDEPEISSFEAEGVVPMPMQVEYLEQLRLVMRTMGD